MLPGFAGVGGFVDAVAGGKIGATQAFAAAYVDDVGIGWGHGERADGAGGLAVEDGDPGAAGVGGLPDAAVVYADVEEIGIAGDAGGGYGAASAEGADAAPLRDSRRGWWGIAAGRRPRWCCLLRSIARRRRKMIARGRAAASNPEGLQEMRLLKSVCLFAAGTSWPAPCIRKNYTT